MANLLVLIELCNGTVLPVSLEALGQSRRIATELGATLYALLPLPEAPAYGDDDIIARCARHGADKVVLLTDDLLLSEAEMRFGTHGRAVLAACEQLPPALLVMGATRGARDLAARVAARLGAAFLPEGWLSMSEGRLQLHDRAGRRLGDDDGVEHAVVLTVPPGRYAVGQGGEEAEMVIVASPPGPPGFVELEHRGALPGEAPASLLIAESPVPPVAGAVLVALGAVAEDDPHAHYALREGGEALHQALGEGGA